jgi:phenylacetate-CoA ligase
MDLLRKELPRHLRMYLYDTLKGLSVRHEMDKLRDLARLDRADLDVYRNNRLRSLIHHCYDNVPFYRTLMDERGLTPEDITQIEELPKIPPLTRLDLRKHLNDLIAQDVDLSKCVQNKSSGSTGEPVVSFHDREAQSASIAARFYCWGVAGWQMGDPMVQIRGGSRTTLEAWSKPSSRLWSWLIKRRRFWAYELVEQHKLDTLLYEVHRYKPDFLLGYANALAALATRAIDLGLPKLDCRAALTFAESLFEQNRKMIEAQFGPVYDQYGCNEIWAIAYQCNKRQGYHVLEPHVVVELEPLSHAGDGSSRVLVTDLDNFAMPLIRYQVGDLATMDTAQECACGSIFQRLERIVGRETDLIETARGGYYLVPGFPVGSIIRSIETIRQFQVAVLRDGTIELRLVSEKPLSSEERTLLGDHLEEYLGRETKLRIRRVDSILPSPSGKVNLVVRE